MITCNPVSLSNGTYYQAGRMVASSVVQGGPGICCLSPAIYFILAWKPEWCSPNAEDLHDPVARECVQKV